MTDTRRGDGQTTNGIRLGFFGVKRRETPYVHGNTGNSIHAEAARRLFADHEDVTTSVAPADLERVRAACTHLGWVAATTIQLNGKETRTERYAQEAAFIAAAKMPVVPFGLGCDASIGATVKAAQIDPVTIRLLKTVADHAPVIAVRGEFTADVLASIGIDNIYLTGCQSAYFGTVRHDPEAFTHHEDGRCYVTMTADPREDVVLAFAVENGIDFIGQVDDFAERMRDRKLDINDFYIHRGAFRIHRRNIVKNTLRDADTFVNMLQYVVSGRIRDIEKDLTFGAPTYLESALRKGIISKEKYNEYVKEFFKKFYDVDEWLQNLESLYNFGFGTRFHGNMAGLIAGMPVLWLVHDMRTRELCDLLGLPNMALNRFPEITSLAELKARCDYGPYVKGFPARLRRFLGYFERHGVESGLHPEFRAGADRWLHRDSADVSSR